MIGTLAVILLSSCQHRSEVIIQEYIDAHNGHNVELALSFYHPDIVFEIEGVWKKSGLEQMRQLEQWDSTLNSHLEIEVISTNPSGVTCNIEESSDWFKAIGMPRIYHDSVVFELKENRITRIFARSSEADNKAIGEKIGSIYQWSTTNGDSSILELFHENQFIYSSESAEKWKRLLKEWKKFDQ